MTRISWPEEKSFPKTFTKAIVIGKVTKEDVP